MIKLILSANFLHGRWQILLADKISKLYQSSDISLTELVFDTLSACFEISSVDYRTSVAERIIDGLIVIFIWLNTHTGT